MSWTPGAWDQNIMVICMVKKVQRIQLHLMMGECVTGCTDANATNFNADADISDDSCNMLQLKDVQMSQHVTLIQMHK